jgi:hypothetical protein
MPDMNDWNRRLIEEFRANGGKVGGMWEGRLEQGVLWYGWANHSHRTPFTFF